MSRTRLPHGPHPHLLHKAIFQIGRTNSVGSWCLSSYTACFLKFCTMLIFVSYQILFFENLYHSIDQTYINAVISCLIEYLFGLAPADASVKAEVRQKKPKIRSRNY
jgi:hypothetical protein